ncbi:MAG: MotA/TolQ/ExbB proton channel family protein [Gammaproteobacteria bacterium]|nr:MotA/TolQ/ExbB proton channel family protein [Gammaproteobacteria bacterium]
MNDTTVRVCAAICGLIIGAIFIGVMSLTLPANFGETLLDLSSEYYPFTIQNLMWLLFFVGLSDVLVRFIRGSRELRQMRLHLLPEDEETMLRAQDLGPIYTRVRPPPLVEPNFLQRLIMRIALQFQSGRSVAQANALLNSSLELFQHEIDLKYNMMRYMVWLIPTLGFIGTVVGIADALGEAGDMPDTSDQSALTDWMKELTGSLGLAFDTTLVALLLSAVLVFLMHVAQGREESALNRAGQYCLDNLVNRLYEK